MSLPIGLILEGVVALLLVLTLIYCFILDRRLRDLRSGQDGLRDLVAALDGATDRAQASIGLLRQASENAGNDLRETVGPARALADELSLMIESGNNLADRLEGRRKAEAETPAHTASNAARPPRSATPPPASAPASAAPVPAPAATARAPEAAAPTARAAHDEDAAYEDRLLRALRDAR